MATAVATTLKASSIIHPPVRPWTPSGPAVTIVAAPQRQLRKVQGHSWPPFVRIASAAAVSGWPSGRDRGQEPRGDREKRNQAPPAEGRTPLTYLVQTATLEWDPYGTSLHIWRIPSWDPSERFHGGVFQIDIGLWACLDSCCLFLLPSLPLASGLPFAPWGWGGGGSRGDWDAGDAGAVSRACEVRGSLGRVHGLQASLGEAWP